MKLQLANKYDPTKNYKVSHWYATPKMDGIRAAYYDGKLWSRTNKPIVGLEHIEKELACLNFPFIDGELYHPALDFSSIQSIVSERINIDYEQKVKVCFVVFAINSDDIKNTEQMYDKMMALKLHYPIYCVSCILIENKLEKINEICAGCVSNGFEGIMLRHPQVHYHYGRSNHLLKHKLFMEDDFLVTGSFEGQGKYVGMLGGITVEGHGVKSEVGTGFTDEQRVKYWKHRLDGKTVEIKYQEKTPDSLRFPVFLKIKEEL